jgi:hypothetical protein
VIAVLQLSGPLTRLRGGLGLCEGKDEPKHGFRKAVVVLKPPIEAKEVSKILPAIEREQALLNLALTSDSRCVAPSALSNGWFAS